MILLLLYWLLTPILWIIIIISSCFNHKIRHHWLNERKTWLSVKKICKNNDKSIVLFHASSKGEFEQLKPILYKINREKYFILQTFFSPTVYKIEKDTSLADAICYHPFDFFWNAIFFFRLINIQYYITTRNDIWPTHLFIAKWIGINTILINANVYKDSHYKSFFLKRFYKIIFQKFDLILTGSDRLKNKLIQLVPENKIHITGDSRLDRVLHRKTKCNKNLLPEIYNRSKTMIWGSVDRTDYPILFEGLALYYPKGNTSLEEKGHRLIIVPHEVDSKNLKMLNSHLEKLNFEYAYYSEKNQLESNRIIIIDKVGILLDLYQYADIAYIGEGFKDGIHSVLEPAVYYNAISFGPQYHIVDMAVNLIDMKLANIIKSGNDFFNFIELLDNDQRRKKIKQSMQKYISNQQLATEKIINTIFKNE